MLKLNSVRHFLKFQRKGCTHFWMMQKRMRLRLLNPYDIGGFNWMKKDIKVGIQDTY